MNEHLFREEREKAILSEYFKTGKIRTKKAFYLLYTKGLLGNRPKMWRTLQEALQSSWSGTFSIRVTIPGWVGMYKVAKEDLQSEVEKLREQGIMERDMVFNQSMDDDKLLIQGEIIDIPPEEAKGIPGGMYLTYSRIKKPMKLGLKEQTLHARGTQAVQLLRRYLSFESQKEIQDLINTFPGHTVEFSAYEIDVGDLPNRNTIIWEVRAY